MSTSFDYIVADINLIHRKVESRHPEYVIHGCWGYPIPQSLLRVVYSINGRKLILSKKLIWFTENNTVSGFSER